MSKFYLFDYIKKNSGINDDILESLKLDLDKRIYYYGQHFKFPQEGRWQLRNALSYGIKSFIKDYFIYYKIIFNKAIFDRRKNNILSNSYFTINSELEKLGYGVYSSSWCVSGSRNVLTDFNLYKKTQQLNWMLRTGTFKELYSDDFVKEIVSFKKLLKDFILKKNLAAICVPVSTLFFENIALKIFKDLNRPSFIFLHGLPAWYSVTEDDRADYLIVWGEKIKENYVKAGMRPEKILISGHPYYKDFNVKELRFNLDNVLIITKSMSGAQYGDRVVLSDRGNLIIYLYSIQNALLKAGVKSARLRPHPSENYLWYNKFIDTNFYKIDKYPLSRSLKEATLVIGPTSSILLEATYYGVNYIVYEPSKDDFDLIDLKLVPPFDGSDVRIPVAKTEGELTHFIKNKVKNTHTFFPEYIKSPFNIGFMTKIVQGRN